MTRAIGLVLLAIFAMACGGSDGGNGTPDVPAPETVDTDAGPEIPVGTIDTLDPRELPEDVPAPADPGRENSPGDVTPFDPGPQGCGTGPACEAGQKCCVGLTGATCKPEAESCGGGGFTCETDAECGEGSVCCDYFGGGMKMCLPDSMCPGEVGGCTETTDCKEGQVCCKFGDMATTPTCMAEPMCPKNCTTNEDCPSTQECCDLKDNVVCIDKGQCPQRCNHSTAECPLGQECCDAGDGLLVCVSASECPGSIACPDAEYVCKNSEGEPNGFTCCEVPELGFHCVGSGGCTDWGTCATHEDCPVGRECCALEQGSTCVPTGACPSPAVNLPPCHAPSDCTAEGEVCCQVPGTGTVCALAAACPSNCLRDSDCGQGAVCCQPADNPWSCTPPAQCITGAPCATAGDCLEGQECCDVQGSKTCMPQGQCIGGSCTKDDDCPDGQKCCTFFGQMQMCAPQCF